MVRILLFFFSSLSYRAWIRGSMGVLLYLLPHVANLLFIETNTLLSAVGSDQKLLGNYFNYIFPPPSITMCTHTGKTSLILHHNALMIFFGNFAMRIMFLSPSYHQLLIKKTKQKKNLILNSEM